MKKILVLFITLTFHNVFAVEATSNLWTESIDNNDGTITYRNIEMRLASRVGSLGVAFYNYDKCKSDHKCQEGLLLDGIKMQSNFFCEYLDHDYSILELTKVESTDANNEDFQFVFNYRGDAPYIALNEIYRLKLHRLKHNTIEAPSFSITEIVCVKKNMTL